MNESHYICGLTPELLMLAKRKQRDEDTAKLFYGQTDQQVLLVVKEAVESEQQQRRIAAFANAVKNLLDPERFLNLKMCNRKQY